MVRHQDEPMQVAILASVANISLSHYFAVFKKVTGLTPMDYFIRLKMHRARMLLDDTPMSVQEVAAALGYDDPFYFSRVFKAFHDVAPSEYRSLPHELKVKSGYTAVKLMDEPMADSRSSLGANTQTPEETVQISTRRDYRVAEYA